jgi:hypothetical protein
MAENSNDSPDIPKGSVSWTSEDRKLLIITIAATVIANIATIIIVALSIIALRWMRPAPGATRGDYAIFWLFSLAPISTVFLTFIWWRDSRRDKEVSNGWRANRWIVIPIFAFEALFLLLYVLAALGLAVGLN